MNEYCFNSPCKQSLFCKLLEFFSLYGETKTGKIESSSKRNCSVASVRRETRILFYL